MIWVPWSSMLWTMNYEIKRLIFKEDFIKLDRIKYWIYSKNRILRGKYAYINWRSKIGYPVVEYIAKDPEIYCVFMDLFSHTKKIIPLLLRHIPVFDLSTLNNIYNWDIISWYIRIKNWIFNLHQFNQLV